MALLTIGCGKGSEAPADIEVSKEDILTQEFEFYSDDE